MVVLMPRTRLSKMKFQRCLLVEDLVRNRLLMWRVVLKLKTLLQVMMSGRKTNHSGKVKGVLLKFLN